MNSSWRKSTHSVKDQCVEVGRPERRLAVRDSTDPDGLWLTFTAENWDRFLARVQKVTA